MLFQCLCRQMVFRLLFARRVVPTIQVLLLPCGGRRDFSFNAIATQKQKAPMDATKDQSQHLILAVSLDLARYFLDKIK